MHKWSEISPAHLEPETTREKKEKKKKNEQEKNEQEKKKVKVDTKGKRTKEKVDTKGTTGKGRKNKESADTKGSHKSVFMSFGSACTDSSSIRSLTCGVVGDNGVNGVVGDNNGVDGSALLPSHIT
jgi:hypothetical protein